MPTRSSFSSGSSRRRRWWNPTDGGGRRWRRSGERGAWRRARAAATAGSPTSRITAISSTAPCGGCRPGCRGPSTCAAAARRSRIRGSSGAARATRLQALVEMRACLADGYPFVFGFTVYESFESERVAATGIVPMPRPREKVLGGHAVLAVGYDDAKKRFLVRNSWGTGWGMQGYFTMPYDYLASRDLSDDFWTIRRQEGF